MFKMLTHKLIVSQIQSEDWILMIDLKEGYIHIEIQEGTAKSVLGRSKVPFLKSSLH